MALPRRMDGRDFGPPRSVHGPPPPLLSGLAMDSHRVGTAAAGRLPASGLPGPLPPGKYMAGLNLHPHPGKCPAPWPPPPVPAGSWGGRPGKNCSCCSWAFSAGTRHFPFPRRVHGSKGRLQRPVPRTRRKGVRGSVAFPGAPVPSQNTRVSRNPTHRGRNPGALAAPAQGRVFKIWARKE